MTNPPTLIEFLQRLKQSDNVLHISTYRAGYDQAIDEVLQFLKENTIPAIQKGIEINENLHGKPWDIIRYHQRYFLHILGADKLEEKK